MSRRRGCLWFGAGLLLAVTGAIVAYLAIQSAVSVPQLAPEVPGVPVLVAARDIPLHTVVEAADVTVREVPPEMVAEDGLRDPADAIGRLTTADIARGEVVLSRRLIVPDYSGPKTAFVMDPQHLLVAIPANDLLSGLEIIRPGDKVEIMLTYNFANSKPEIQVDVNTFVALPEVRIASIMRGAGEGGRPGPVRAFLLALDPQDALTLKHLRDMGAAVDLALRSPAAPEGPFEVVPVDGDYLLKRYNIRWQASQQ